MKNILVIFVLYFFSNISAQIGYQFNTLDKNNISIRVNNTAGLQKIGEYEIGAVWNKISGIILYNQGFWVIGKINNYPHLAYSQYNSAYTPGPIINGKPAIIENPEDSLKYRVYKISKNDNDTNIDYAEWPSDIGAPTDSSGNPLVFGDQTLWTVFNSFDSSNNYRIYWNEMSDSLPRIPIEVQELVYSREGNYPDSVDIFSNTIFFEWTIINKGNDQIDSAYISLWTDIDFIDVLNNPPAVDTINQIGYCWANYDQDQQPAVGYTLLYGPAVPSLGDTAVFKGKELAGYKNLSMSSFFPIPDNGKEPNEPPLQTLAAGWNIARGFSLSGDTVIDPTTGMATKFRYSGDPVTQTGWIHSGLTGGSAGFNIFSGPFNLASNDTQWVMMALIPALGNDRYQSIIQMRKKAKLLKSIPYDSLAFGSNPLIVGIDGNKKFFPEKFRLYQNYPNPFNPSTQIKYSIKNDGLVTIKVFDILGREIAILVNEFQSAGEYEINFNASNLSSGIYFYSITSGKFHDTKKMILLR